jgi:fimbrial chaperone protein
MNHSLAETVAAAMILLSLAQAPALGQASFSIDPLLIRFNADTKTVVLTITNTSSKEIRFEIKPYSWDQTPPDGTMQLTATSDIILFPPLVTLKPHGVQRVRVGTTAAQGAVEKAYRLMVEELPSGVAAPGDTTVAVRTRVGLPVFVEATRTAVSGGIESIRLEKGVVSILLTNTGSSHAMVDSVVVRGMAASDQVLFEDSLQGWYVLAGKTRTWRYAMKPAQCKGIRAVEIEVYAHEQVITRAADIPAGFCAR